MPIDSVFMQALTDELKVLAIGARIDKVHQPEKDELVFSMRGEKNFKLLISCASGSARVQVTEMRYENPAQPPMFCMLLRKHLTGAKITDITVIPGERIMNISLAGFSELGLESSKHLIFEIVGSRSNLLLCDDETRIIDCIHRSDSEIRRLLPGLFYFPPEPMGKTDPMTVEPNCLKCMLSEAQKGTLLDKWLCASFSGLSPLICREITSRAFGNCNIRTDETEPDKLCRCFEEFTTAVAEKHFVPVLLSEGEKMLDFSYMPITQYGTYAETEQCPSFSVLLDTFYMRKSRADNMRQRAASLTKIMRNARDRAMRRLENQRKELANALDREQLRVSGDIITANMYKLKKGDRILKAQNFYDENCAEIEIHLDPLLTPQENAARYYKNYKKAKKAELALAEQIDKGETELDYCESVLDEITRAGSPSELADIRQELVDSGYVAKQKGRQPKRQESKPLHFILPSGINIFVGKNNVMNDRMTFKSAMRTDLWLHTQKIHGSHVIVACAGREADRETVVAAAQLAAHYSKARGEKNVPVDYTLVKFVKKPSGGKPGAAIYTDYKTVFVDAEIPKDVKKM